MHVVVHLGVEDHEIERHFPSTALLLVSVSCTAPADTSLQLDCYEVPWTNLLPREVLTSAASMHIVT